MSSITVDAQFLNLLNSLTDITEIRDAQGRIVGLFTPQPLTDQQRAIDKARQWFDLEKAQRILEQERDQGISTAEMMKKLQALDPSR